MSVLAADRPPTASPQDARGLRVLAFCDYFGPSTGGGAERVAFEVYRRLAAWGASITVVTAGTAASWNEGLRVVRAPAIDLTPRLGVQSLVTNGATRLGARLATQIDPHVLHANSVQFQTSVAAARLSRRGGVPLVLTAHLGGFDALPQPLRAAATMHERTVGRYLLSRSRAVIAVSDAVAEHLAGLGAGGRVRVVANGVDHERFHPPPRSAPATKRTDVLFVGRLVPNKGPALLVEAFSRIRRDGVPGRLTIAGDGPIRPRLEARVRELGLGDHVRFVGFTDRVEDLLRRAHVFVRPTLTEGMPLAVLEAMAAGLCVVASDVPGNRSLVADGVTGLLFRTGDEEALAAALRRVIGDRVERRRLARAGHVASLDHSWDRCASETLDVLLRAVPAVATGGAR